MRATAGVFPNVCQASFATIRVGMEIGGGISEMADALQALFLPALLVGVVCILLWRYLPGHNRPVALLVFGAALFAIPQFLVVIVGTMATELLPYRQVVLAIWLTLAAVVAEWQVVRALAGRPFLMSRYGERQRTAGPVIVGVLALAFGAVGLYLAVLSAEDLLLPHQILEGPISRKWVTQGRRSSPHYHLRLNSQNVEIGRDLYGRLRRGETVRLEVTSGSHTVVKADLAVY